LEERIKDFSSLADLLDGITCSEEFHDYIEKRAKAIAAEWLNEKENDNDEAYDHSQDNSSYLMP